MVSSILVTKIALPKPRTDLVPRARLIAQLNAGLDGKLTLLSAPAGFGKTTLASIWARQMHPHVAWLSLDEHDNDRARFLSYVIAAMQQVDASIGQEAQQKLRSLRSPQSPPVQALLVALLNQINNLSHPLMLFLDDYHLISEPSIHEMVTYLLEHMPASMHLVIVSRADPALPISGLRGKGELNELRQLDLQFTAEEAAGFLRQVMQVEIEADDLQALHQRTEG